MSDIVLAATGVGSIALSVDDSPLELAASPGSLSLGIAVGQATGEANVATNVGGGAGISRDKTGVSLNLRTITGSGGLTVTEGADEIDVSAAGAVLSSKSGIAIAGSFAGTPKKAAITFATPFGSTNYSVTFDPVTTGGGRYAMIAESKTANGFVISLGSSNILGLDHVGWQAVLAGET